MRESDSDPDGQGADRSAVGRRPFLQSVGVAGAASAFGGIATETARADTPEEWASGGDEYYSTLVDDLQNGLELPAAKFIYDNTESGTRSSFFATASDDSGDYGTASSLDVSGDGVPFSEADRFEVTSPPPDGEEYRVQLRGNFPDEESVSEGDVMLGVAYLRSPDGDGTISYQATNNDDFSNDTASNAQPEITGEWTRHYFPIEWSVDDGVGTLYIQFQVGFSEQTVDIGGVALLDFGANADVGELPSGPAGQTFGPYYQQLVDDVTGRGLPEPEFAIGNTESTVRNSSSVFTENPNGNLTSPDPPGDVPFSNVDRFEVTSEPDNNYDVQYVANIPSEVSAGDVMLGAAYLRSPDGSPQVEFHAVDSNDFGNHVVSNSSPSIGSEWQLHYFPIEFGTDSAGEDRRYVQFQLGFQQQTIEIGGFALMDYGGDVAVGDLPSGAVTLGGSDDGGGDDTSGWPDLSDPYYAWVVEELREDGLPAAEFVYADSESGTLDGHFTDNSAGSMDTLNVDGDPVPFSQALRFEVSDPSNNYDAQVRTGLNNTDFPSVSAGDALLGVAYLRAPDGDAQIQFSARNDNSDGFNDVVSGAQPDIGSEWQRFYFPIEVSADADAGTWWTEFWLGYQSQTVDIGGIAVLDFDTGLAAGDLPSGAADTDDYYGSLVRDVAGMDLPVPEVAFANSEQATLDSSSVFAANPAGTVSQAAPEADVPFSVATTFDVTSAPDNTYSVQLRGDIPQDISAGDVMLGVAYLRSPSDDPQASFYALDSGEVSNRVAGNANPTIASEWERHYFPIQFGADSSGDGRRYVQFRLGFEGQTVEVGGFALLDFDGEANVGDLPSGVPGPNLFEEWPDVSDPYYQTLVDDLRGRDLPAAGRFVYADSEPDAFEFYELARPGEESPGAANVSGVSVGDDVPFSEATRIDVTEAPENAYEFSFKATVPEDGRSVSSGDTLLGVAYFRTPDDGTRTVNYKSVDNPNISQNYVTKSRPTVTGEWQRFYFPVEFGADGAAGDWFTEIWLGQEVQTVDVGGLALLYFAEGVPVGDLPVWQESPAPGWEDAADQRIQDNRVDDLTIEVTDGNGDPVADADVEIEMQEHDFGFGCLVNASHLRDNTEAGDPYRENREELFNLGVLENNHKWRFWETEREAADFATDWMSDLGWDIRGHVCLWAAVDSYAVPDDVVEAMGVAWEDQDIEAGEPDPEYVERETLAHVEDIISYYGLQIDEWEVYNELIPQPGFVEAINGGSLEGMNVNEAPILADWFEAARDAAPEGTPLAINDYNTLVGPYSGRRDGYETQIQFLKDQGAGLDAVGMQSHFSQGDALLPSEIMAALDRYASNDVRLRVTEFDMSDDTWAEEDKADFFHWFLKTVFSHPAVDQFVVWGLIDTLHWRDDAPFYAEGWEEKPAAPTRCPSPPRTRTAG